jgi:NAD(P)-dependent dehydrogenase (short-subunit alcohol dehydrogenase family)
MSKWAGKVAVVTGAASGIGLGLAERFAAEGMKLVLADIDPQLPAVGERLRAKGIDAITVHTDVADGDQVNALAQKALESFGGVHIACNNAGTGGPSAFTDLRLEDWQFQIGVNLWGVINGVRAFLPIMLEQNEGHIVNTASMGGLIHGPYIAPYNVSKAGVVALTETLHHELALSGSNVGVSVLCPGAVQTNMNNEPNVPAERKMLARKASPAIEQLRRSLVEQLDQHGLDVPAVAAMVLDAIEKGRVHILTNPEFTPLLQQRIDGIIGSAQSQAIDLDDLVKLAETSGRQTASPGS